MKSRGFFIFFWMPLILLHGGLMGQRLKPAQFEFGQDLIVHSFKVGANGGNYTVENSGTPIDGITIQFPPGAVEKEITISIGYNDGKLELPAGKGSGVYFFFKMEPGLKLQEPVKIFIPFDKSVKALTITGYAIDKKGRLHLVDTGGTDEAAGTVSFFTFKPIILTWVYIMN